LELLPIRRLKQTPQNNARQNKQDLYMSSQTLKVQIKKSKMFQPLRFYASMKQQVKKKVKLDRELLIKPMSLCNSAQQIVKPP
jgi:hypothetical protein